jgi:hypothetical protein
MKTQLHPDHALKSFSQNMLLLAPDGAQQSFFQFSEIDVAMNSGSVYYHLDLVRSSIRKSAICSLKHTWPFALK